MAQCISPSSIAARCRKSGTAQAQLAGRALTGVGVECASVARWAYCSFTDSDVAVSSQLRSTGLRRMRYQPV